MTDPPLSLNPPVRQLKSLLYGVTDETLARATPCSAWTLGDLIDHVANFTAAFTAAARRSAGDPGVLASQAAVADLHPQWRSRLPSQLDELVTAWSDPHAWLGSTATGGVSLPAEQLGLVAAAELTVHGWDIARATGQDFAADPRILRVLIDFLADGATRGLPGGYGPPVDVHDEASLLERTVALSGRDPFWRP